MNDEIVGENIPNVAVTLTKMYCIKNRDCTVKVSLDADPIVRIIPQVFLHNATI